MSNPRINYREAARCGNCVHREKPHSYWGGARCLLDGTDQPVDRTWICERHEYAEPPKRAEVAGTRRERSDGEK